MNENENKTFADVIVELRKEKGFTQQDLANKLHITDKAVSKWERGLSYPDITSISTLASILGVDSSYLIDLCKSEDNPYLDSDKKEDIKKLIQMIFKGVGLAMGGIRCSIKYNESTICKRVNYYVVNWSCLSWHFIYIK